MTNLDNILKSRDITLQTKVHLVKAMVFPVVIYGCELDHKESWVQKNWCFWSVVLEKTLSPLDSKEIQPVHPKGNQSWMYTGRTDAETEAPILWPPDVKCRLIRKDPDAGKDWSRRRRERQRMTLLTNTDTMDMSLRKLWEMVKDKDTWHAILHGVVKSQTWLSNWKTTNLVILAQTINESAYHAGDPGSIPGSGRSPGEGNG